MATRERVKTDRRGITKKREACGFEFYVTVNFYDEVRPSEIFITIAKHGSVIAGFARALAVLMSVLLQYGATWEVIYVKMGKMKFDPCDDDYTSLVDAIVQTVDEIVKGKEHAESENKEMR